jgi:hypothetical protein
MVKWLTVVIVNRLVFILAVILALNAFARSTCYPGDNPVGQLGQAFSSLRDIVGALR